MTTDSFDERLSRWLDERSARRVPGHLDEVLARTGSMRQRAWWASPERWLPMDTTSRLNLFALPSFRRALVVMALLVALAGLVAYLAGTQARHLPLPYGPAANGPILYAAKGDIYQAEADGTDPRVLVGGPGEDVAVAASLDGTRFVFMRTVSDDVHDLLVANADGGGLRTLTPAPLREIDWVDWSPDGTRLAVRHRTNGPATISIINVDGAATMRDLDLGGIQPDSPAWRPPDGREIMFRGELGAHRSLYAISPDGTGLRSIAPSLGGDAYLGFRVSQDGTRATYWHNKEVDRTPSDEYRKSEVHVLDIDTGRDVRIAYDPESRHEISPRFSPDGASILLVRFSPGKDASILIAPADGSGAARQIGPYQPWVGDPRADFSPDGTKVLLSMNESYRLQVIDIKTGLIAWGEIGNYPSWVRLAP